MSKTYRCKHCPFRGPRELVLRHGNLHHKPASEQPACSVCGAVAEVWATSAHKTARCNQHANRYGLCRWCGQPRETGWGSGSIACHCGRMGYLREETIAVPTVAAAPPEGVDLV